MRPWFQRLRSADAVAASSPPPPPPAAACDYVDSGDGIGKNRASACRQHDTGVGSSSVWFDLCGTRRRDGTTAHELASLMGPETDTIPVKEQPPSVEPTSVKTKRRNPLSFMMGDSHKSKPLKERDKEVKESKLAQNGRASSTSSASDVPVGQVCRIEDSPFRIMKVASTGNLKEFKRLYTADNSRLFLRDSKGWTVTHHAVTKCRLQILQYIVDNDGALDTQDKKGNTPLHIAVEKSKPAAITFLLENGANPAILNQQEMAPIHMAVEAGHVTVLQALLASDQVDANLLGEAGQTPLHYAAAADRLDCAQKLLERETNLSQTCDIGLSPVHVAAKQSSVQVLELLLKHSEEQGTAKQVLAATDKDRNTLLHAAVNSGCLEAVRICLKYSSAIDTQQSDRSTPLHLACAQGNLQMVKAMLEAQPERLETVLFAKDAMDMSPLHTATLYDHTDIVDYLVDQGCDIDGRDREERTPLLIASSNQARETLKVLLDKGADVQIKDKRNRTFLHLAIINGARLQEFGTDVFQKAMPLLNEMDDFGCTPLHYASKQGHLPAIERLIMMGAFLNIKNKDKQSPLHFAACYGRLNTCRRLLESPQGSKIINEIGGEGLTALHQASAGGHTKVVQYLMQKGALLHRDNRGNTPLHLAAENGYTQTIKLIMGVHSHVLNTQNNDGDTALHLAASSGHASAVALLMSTSAEFTQNKGHSYFLDLAIQNRHKEVAHCVVTHERWREALELHSQHGSPLVQLIKHLPEICLAVLDRCQTASGHNTKSRDFHHHYDFRYLQTPIHLRAALHKRGEESVPMAPLNVMVKFNRVECLSHPVCVTFLKMKWRAYGFWFHLLNIGAYVVFLFFLTTYIVSHDPALHTDNHRILNMSSGLYMSRDESYIEVKPLERICMLAVTAFCGFNILKELMQMMQQKAKYFRDLTNLLEWVLYLTCGFFVGPSLFGYYTHEQWQTGAVAVFLAWFNFLLYLQRFDFFGIYVVMFLEILRTLVQVIVVFSILIVAFGLSFYILLRSENNSSHVTPALSFIRTFIMMLGEIDYIPLFAQPLYDDDARSMHYSTLTFVFLIVFVLFMPILLMNLLIGLAVGDIESVQRNARLKRLAMQVELHTDLERKIPRRLLQRVDKVEYRVYNTSNRNAFTRLVSRLCHDTDDDSDSVGPGLGGTGCTTRVSNEPGGRGPASFYMEAYHHQKRKLKELSASMEKQHDLLRLIVQKMEIRTEADDKDTAFGEQEAPLGGSTIRDSFRWSAPTLSKQLVPQASIVSYWSKKTSGSTSDNTKV